jgi:hypothetical protein
MGLYGLQKQVEIVAELWGPKVLTYGLQGLLGGLLTGEATPGPMLPWEQITPCTELSQGLVQPILHPLHRCPS